MKNYDEVVDLVNSEYSSDTAANRYGDVENMNEHNALRVKVKLRQNWSVGIFDKITNELLAVNMNTIERKSLEITDDDYKRLGFRLNSRLQQINRFFDTLQAGVFDILGVEKVFYWGMGAVRSKYRKKNLLGLLGYASYRLAWESGCKYIVACPTTDFLCKSMETHGWTVLRKINFSDYDAEHGTSLFANAKYPNSKAQLMCKMTDPPADYMPVAKL